MFSAKCAKVLTAKQLCEIEKAEAREHFENQLRYAFAKYDAVDDEDENSEVFLGFFI